MPAPKSPSLTERVSDMRRELDQTETERKRDVNELRQSISGNTKSITELTEIVSKIAANINGFSMESFSETLDKLVMLIDGDDSRDVTGLRNRVRTVEEVQATQNKALDRIEKKINRLGILVIIASAIMSLVGEGGAIPVLEAIAKFFAIP